MNPVCQRQISDLLGMLYEDDTLLVVSKPSGLDTSRLRDVDSIGLTEVLERLYPQRAPVEPVNRLSRFESGIVVLCREPSLRDRLRASWNAGKVHQEYILVARGRMSRRSMLLAASDDSRDMNADPATSRAAPLGMTTFRGQGGRKKPDIRMRNTVRHHGRARGRSTATSSKDTVLVELIHRGEHRLVLRCRTGLRSTHALKAALRAAGLHPLGDTRGGDRARRDRPERTCLHLQRVSFTHPVTGRSVRLTAPQPVGFEETAEGQEPFELLLRKALARRLELMLDDTTDAWRVFCGDAEGVPGITLEKYADVLVMHLLDGRNLPPRAVRQHIARCCRRELGLRSVYAKISPRDRSHLPPDELIALTPGRPLWGSPVEGPVFVTERGLRFETHPLDPLATGIYLDHREHRRRVRELAEGKRVLNLFAYTCAFSVAAAAGGAASVVSVDQSKKSLEWGKRNFALNGLPLTPHRFLNDEVFEYLARAARRGEAYDLIIVDPPTFARMKRGKGRFHVEKDLPGLVAAGLGVLAPGGMMLVASNYRSMTHARFQSLVRQGTTGARVRLLPASPLPADFAADPQHHKAVWVRTESRR